MDTSKRKICNAINCYFANEVLDNSAFCSNTEKNDCIFCSYSFDNIAKTRNFIRYELNRNKKTAQKAFSKIFFGTLVCGFAIVVSIIMVLFFWGYFKAIK